MKTRELGKAMLRDSNGKRWDNSMLIFKKKDYYSCPLLFLFLIVQIQLQSGKKSFFLYY